MAVSVFEGTRLQQTLRSIQCMPGSTYAEKTAAYLKKKEYDWSVSASLVGNEWAVIGIEVDLLRELLRHLKEIDSDERGLYALANEICERSETTFASKAQAYCKSLQDESEHLAHESAEWQRCKSLERLVANVISHELVRSRPQRPKGPVPVT